MKKILLFGILVLLGIYLASSIPSARFGAQVQTTDTLNTFRTEFNSLDALVRSTTSTLGTFSNLATTTGNIAVASSSVGWSALAVGTNTRCLVASSTAPLGVSWELCFSTSSAHSWSMAQAFNGGFTFANATGTGNLQSNTFTGNQIFGVASTSIQQSSFSINLVSPSSTTDGNFASHQFRIPITLTRLDCFDALGTSTITIDRRSSSTPNTAGSAMIGALACGNNRGSTTTFSIATATVDYILTFQVTSTAGIGSSSTLSIIGQYTK